MESRLTGMRDQLCGVIAFAVTPFNDDAEYSINWHAFEDHVATLAASGVSTVVVAGGTGEGFSLRPSEVVEITRRAAPITAGRVALLVGAGFGSTQAREIARAAQDAGADGLLILPPYYPNPDPGGLVAYYRAIASAVPELGVAIYGRAGAVITPTVLDGLRDMINIVALKDGTGDVRMFQRNRAQFGDRFAWIAGVGDDLVAAYAAAGAEGYTSSIACYDPRLSLHLWDLAKSGRFDELRELSAERVLPWFSLRALKPGYEVAVVKATMEEFGHVAGTVRPPLTPVTPDVRAEIKSLVAQLGLHSAAVLRP